MGGWTIDNVCVYGVPKIVETPLDGEEEDGNYLPAVNRIMDIFSWSILGLGLLGFRRRR